MTLNRIPLFISSTFRDMHAERDFLRNVVFPDLEERLHQHGCFMDPVDLRWGVDPSHAVDRESEERLILRLCLEEIDRSRPLFIGLLGDRYGWVPDSPTMEAALDGTGLPPSPKLESVTALEIRYGALVDKGRSDRTLFYFRELDSRTMSPEDRAHYSDRAAGRESSADLLDQLKSELQSLMPHSVRSYEASWDADRQRVTGLEQFGRAVLEDLWTLLEPEVAARAVAGGWVARAIRAHDQRMAELGSGFVGRAAPLDLLGAFAQGEGDATPIMVTGGPGCGKSSLLAKLVQQAREEAPGLKVLYHSAPSSAAPRDLDRLLRCWEVELGCAPDRPDYVEAVSGDDRRAHRLSADVLHALSLHQGPVLIVVDGLDELLELGETFLLDAPTLLPRHVRLLASCSVETDEPGWRRVHIGGLDAEEGAAMVRALLTQARKVLPQPVMNALLAQATDTADGGGISPSWLRAAFDDLQSLGEDDFTELGAGGHTGVAGVNALLRQRIAAFPRSLDAMLDRRLAFIESQLGEEPVSVLLKTLTGERGRFPARHLAAVFHWFGLVPRDSAIARARRLLRGWVTVNPDDGLWTIVSKPFLDACQTRYLGDPEARERWHSRFGRFVESLKRAERGDLDNFWHWMLAFDEYDPFERACIDGNVLALRAMVRDGHDLDADGGFGAPPLFTAVSFGTPDAVRTLLDAGANVNAEDQWEGQTPLCYAFNSSNPDPRIIRLLLSRGARLGTEDSSSLLSAAAGTGRLDIVELVVERGADPEALHAAATAASRRGYWPLANWLAEESRKAGGPEVPILTPDEVAWLQAAWDGDVSALNLLRGRVRVNCCDAAGCSALHLTAGRHIEAMAFLLGAGADPNLQDGNGCTPLGTLLHITDPDPEATVDLLLTGGADPRIADTNGRTPLHAAYQQPEVTRRLLEAGADARAKELHFGWTALHYCARWIHSDGDAANRVEVAAALLAADPSLTELRDDEGKTAQDHLAEALDEHASSEAVEDLALMLMPRW
jgi:ankyrin repeat protein